MSRFIALAAAIAVGGCAEAHASTDADPANPVHCGVALSIYYGIAMADKHPSLPEWERRMVWEGRRASRLPAERRTRAEGEALHKALLPDADRTAELVMECVRREDADPDFHAYSRNF